MVIPIVLRPALVGAEPEVASIASMDARVRLLSRPGCHLCDDARVVIESVCTELGIGWEESDISGDERLTREYGELIPVTFVDGARHDVWRVDASLLRAALTGSAQ